MSQVAIRPSAVGINEYLEPAVTVVRNPESWPYPRNDLKAGIVLLGAGDLPAGQLPVLLERYLGRRPSDWMIHAVATAAGDIQMCGALNVNDGMFSVDGHTGRAGEQRKIGAIKRMTHAPSRPEQVERLLVSEEIQIVAVTLQATGYPTDALGDLDVNDPAIRNDMRDDAAPQSVIGHLYCAASNRARMGAPGFTVLSVDDVERNGDIVQRLLVQFAELKDPSVAKWIRDNVTFPNSVIDTTLPVETTPTPRIVVSTGEGLCVARTEPDATWVIEDDFASDRPLLGLAGVTFTQSTEPFEQLRNRILGTTRLGLGYVGALLGFSSPARAMTDSTVARYVQKLVSESRHGLEAPDGVDIDRYGSDVCSRLASINATDGIARCAANGSRALPSTVVASADAALADRGRIDALAFTVAAWCRYLRGVDERGAVFSVDDPLSPQLASRAGMAPNDPAHLLSMTEIFGRRLSSDERFLKNVAKWLGVIDRLGTRNALEHLLDD